MREYEIAYILFIDEFADPACGPPTPGAQAEVSAAGTVASAAGRHML